MINLYLYFILYILINNYKSYRTLDYTSNYIVFNNNNRLKNFYSISNY